MYTCKSTGEIAKDYKEYLITDHWKNKKKELFDWHHYKCCVCNKHTYLEVHHKTYDRIGNEDLEDLLIVCKEHHYKFHKKVINEDDYKNAKLKAKRYKRKRNPNSKARAKRLERYNETKKEYDSKFEELKNNKL